MDTGWAPLILAELIPGDQCHRAGSLDSPEPITQPVATPQIMCFGHVGTNPARMLALTVSWSTAHPCVGGEQWKGDLPHTHTCWQQQWRAGIRHPAPPCTPDCGSGKANRWRQLTRLFTSCCKQPCPVFLPGCCSPCAFASTLGVGQVLCCATLPKLVLPSLLWLRRRKEAGGQTALQSSGLLGRRGSSGTGWGRDLTSVWPKCHFWSRVPFKNRDQFLWSFSGIHFSSCS